MKILYISNAHIPSKTAHSIHIMRMCEAFSARGHDVALMYMAREEDSKVSAWSFYGIPASFSLVGVPIDIRPLGFVRYVMRLYFSIRASRADIAYGRFIAGCLFAAWSGIPTIYESHFPVWEKGHWSALLFRLLIATRSFSHLVVISDALKREYQKHYPSLTIVVAHDGAPIPEETKSAPLRGRQGALRVGYVGSLYEGKGMEVIAELAPLIPEADVHVVGGSEKDVAYWKQRMAAPNVHFYGFVEPHETSAYMHAFDVCLLPIQKTVRPHGSHIINIGSYTSPLKLFEYMAHGKAIVASDVPVIREVVDETCARLIDPTSPAAWASAIKGLCDEKERSTLGTSARERFLHNYTWEKRAEVVLKPCAHTAQ